MLRIRRFILGATAIAKALGIGRASVYQILEARERAVLNLLLAA
jgi:hypothetical protein